MSKAIFEHDTFLFSDEAPAGRLFVAGQQHPGKGWADEPPAPIETLHDAHTIQVADETSAAEWGEKLNAALADLTAKHDEAKAALSAENDDLRGQIASLTEDLRQANEALAKFDEAWAEITTERDGLKAKVDEQAAMIAKFDPDGDGKPGGSAPKAAK